MKTQIAEETRSFDLPTTPAAKRFLAQCKKAASAIGQDFEDCLTWGTDPKSDDQYEDDGNLHIEKAGIHICFGIGQDLPSAEYNRQARLVMETLGMKRKISERVLVEEDDENDENYCSKCGRHCDCEPLW
jgi:hypothetical protein